VPSKFRVRSLLLSVFCGAAIFQLLIAVVVNFNLDGAVAWIARISREDPEMVLFLCFILCLPVLVAYVTKHPKRHSFWWKCALSFAFPPAFFYLIVTALHEPETTKVQKSSTGEQSEFIGEQF
jgi:hypothetical protein